MTPTKQAWSRNRVLVAYSIIAYAFSWAIEIPLALQAQQVVSWNIPMAAHYLASFGPLLAALLVTAGTSGRDGLRDLASRIFRYRVPVVWWLAALSPLLAYLVLATTFSLAQPEWLRLAPLGSVDFLPPIGLGAAALWILTFGLGEEAGWRGFALPRLQAGHNAFTASIILWAIWALWHLPAFFYVYNPAIAPGFLIGVLAGTITLTWLFNSASGSILIVILWHGLFNYTTGCTRCKAGAVSAILSALVIVWALVVVIVFKPANLSRSPRQIE